MRAQYGHSSKWYMMSTPVLFALLASASSLRRSPRNGSKNASQSAAWALALTSRKKKSLAAAVIGPHDFGLTAHRLLELAHQARALLEERRQVLITPGDRSGIAADFFRELGDPLFQISAHRAHILNSGTQSDFLPSLSCQGNVVRPCFLPLSSVHITMRSTNSWTGVCSSFIWSRQSSRIAFCCFSGKRRARLRSNFSMSIGMPSVRR